MLYYVYALVGESIKIWQCIDDYRIHKKVSINQSLERINKLASKKIRVVDGFI